MLSPIYIINEKTASASVTDFDLFPWVTIRKDLESILNSRGADLGFSRETEFQKRKIIQKFVGVLRLTKLSFRAKLS